MTAILPVVRPRRTGGVYFRAARRYLGILLASLILAVGLTATVATAAEAKPADRGPTALSSALPSGGPFLSEAQLRACSVAGSTPVSATWGSQNVTVRTYWVYCTGSNPYIRLQSWKYTDTSDISRTYKFPTDSAPYTVWWEKSTGDTVNSVSAYPQWLNGDTLLLGNQICDVPCGVRIKGVADRISTSDTAFDTFRYIQPTS